MTFSRSQPFRRAATIGKASVIRTSSCHGLCQGGRFGGWSFYVKDGKPAYTYNFLGLQEYTVNGTQRLEPGKATVKLEFAYDGNGRGKGGITIYDNGVNIGSGRVERTQSNVFSLGDCVDVGVDEGTIVSSEYKERENKFTGRILKVQIDTK